MSKREPGLDLLGTWRFRLGGRLLQKLTDVMLTHGKEAFQCLKLKLPAGFTSPT